MVFMLVDELDEEAYVNFLVAHYKSSRPNRRIVERATCLKLSNACVGSEVMDSRHDKEKEKERIERQVSVLFSLSCDWPIHTTCGGLFSDTISLDTFSSIILQEHFQNDMFILLCH